MRTLHVIAFVVLASFLGSCRSMYYSTMEQFGVHKRDILVDRDGRAGVEFGISGVPESYLIGPDGTILGKFGGPLMPDTAETLLESGRPAR